MGVKIEKRHRARELKLDKEGNVSTVLFDVLDEPGHKFESGRKFNPSLSEYSPRQFRTEVLKDPRPSKERELKRVEVDGSLILAVPHNALAELAPANVLMKDPRLGELEKLVSVPMASVHLHLNEKFSQRMKTLQVSLPPEPLHARLQIQAELCEQLGFVAKTGRHLFEHRRFRLRPWVVSATQSIYSRQRVESKFGQTVDQFSRDGVGPYIE